MTAAPRIVATDLDGTIFRSDHTVSDRTRSALARVEDAGAAVVLVTGRPTRWMHDVAEQTGHRGLAICGNGALVYDLHREEVVERSLLDIEAARGVIDALRMHLPDVAFAVERESGFVREAAYRMRWESDDVSVGDLRVLLAEPMTKLLVRHEELSADELLAHASGVVGDRATLTHSSTEGLLEVSGAGVSKASGLARFAEEHGVGPAGVVAFGDMPNDIPMLTWAGHSVAVANAHPEVLEVADEVTASNDEDGVALVLERLYS